MIRRAERRLPPQPTITEEALVALCRKTGLEPSRGQGTLLRCVYESVALKYRAAGEQRSAVSGKPNRVVHIVDGGSRNQFMADASGLKRVAGPEEATAIGIAMVKALGLGVISAMGDAQEPVYATLLVREYKPLGRPARDAAYQMVRAAARE